MKTILIWIVSIVIAGAAIFYQRVTGPTYPLRGSVEVDGTKVSFELPRSHPGEGDAEVSLSVPDSEISGFIEYSRYGGGVDSTRRPLRREGNNLVGLIPHQPPAGKMVYQIVLHKSDSQSAPLTAEGAVIRFRGDVPAYFLLPHIAGMVLAMVWAVRATFEAIFKRRRVFELSLYTIGFIAVGGILLGAIVQKCAFGEYWTGWPLGHDLTDNKTALALLVWLLAAWRVRKDPTARGWVIAAALVMFAAWLIPHSVWGSDLDPTAAPQARSYSAPAAPRANSGNSSVLVALRIS